MAIRNIPEVNSASSSSAVGSVLADGVLNSSSATITKSVPAGTYQLFSYYPISVTIAGTNKVTTSLIPSLITTSSLASSILVESGGNGVAWNSNPSNIAMFSVIYGGDKFVGVSGSFNTTAGAYSTNGTTWTNMTLPFSSSSGYSSVTYGNGLFVAVVPGTTTAASSNDGITWTQRTLPSSSTWKSVTYGNGLFVAAGSAGVAATSPDGITWTARTLPANADWRSVTYGNGVFVAVSSSNAAATSPDGITWTGRTLPGQDSNVVAYGNGAFVTGSDASSTSHISLVQSTPFGIYGPPSTVY
jgi:hypothetical protein